MAAALAPVAIVDGASVTHSRARSVRDIPPSCGGGFQPAWKHGGINHVSVRGINCRAAGRVAVYALDHGLIRPSHEAGSRSNFFILTRRRVRGYRFALVPGTQAIDLTARQGHRRFRFGVCWLNVDC